MTPGARARLRAEARAAAARLGRPFVVLKTASSLDGRIATRSGHSQWITSPEARAHGRGLRAALDAIAVGARTADVDDPALTSRIEGTSDPLRVVFDSRLNLPVSRQLVRTAREIPSVVLTTRAADPGRRARLEARGVEVVLVRKTRSGRVDVGAGLDALFARGVRGLLVEGGATLAGAFVDAGLVDKVYAFVAPLIVGGAGAPGAIGGRGPARLDEALRLTRASVTRVGPDVLVIGYPGPR